MYKDAPPGMQLGSEKDVTGMQKLAIDLHKEVRIIFLDISKALDKVWCLS